MADYILAETEEHFNAARKLITEYAAWLAIDLCFQNFDDELLHLNRMYAPPSGGIILCKVQNEYIGCVGIREFSGEVAEMKRLYVVPEHRKKGIAKRLLEEAEDLAKKFNYKKIKLDTLDTMSPAMNLYESNGYLKTTPYYNNPQPGAVYFEKNI